MTRAKKGGLLPAADVQVSHAFGSTLFERLQASKLKLLFEQVFPDRRVEQRGASTLLMNCVNPAHADRRPSFYVYANINYAHCKSCGYRTRNLLEMLNTSLGFSYAESLIRIHEVTGQRLANEKVSKQIDALDLQQMAARVFGEVCNQHLISLITYGLQGAPVDKTLAPYYNDALFHTVKPVLDWLFTTRNLHPDKVPYLPYGVMPTDKVFDLIARQIIDTTWGQMLQRGVLPSAYSPERREALLKKLHAMHKEVPVEYLHSVTFHMGYGPALPGRIRCRRVNRTIGTDNNYWVMPGFSDNAPLGYLGLFLPRSTGLRQTDPDKCRVICVESEISMLVAQQMVIEHSIPDVMFVASAGSNNETDLLYQAGFTNVDMLMDHPDPNIGKGEEQTKIRLNTAMLAQVRVFSEWEGFRGDVQTVKDPDDVLQTHGWDHFRKYVLDEAEEHFVSSDIWAAGRAIEEGLKFPENKILERQSKAVDFGQCVRHPALLASFVTKVSAALNIPQGPLRAAIVQIKDNEQGLIARIVETIKSDFVILYKDDTHRTGTLVMFHKAERRYVVVNVTDGAGMLASLANIYGEMYTYFVDHIGVQERREGEEHLPSRVAIREGQKFIADYLKIAFQAIYQGVLTLEECTPLGAGVFYEEHPDDPDVAICRIHNGDRWYRLLVDRRTSNVKATELEGPIDGKYIFLPNQPVWSKSITSVEAIHEANNISVDRLKAIYLKICEIVDAGWKFRTQQADVAFISSLVFVLAAGDAFDMKLINRIVGESNSGKSTLLSLLAVGQFPLLSLVEQSGYLTGYTLASLYLMFNRSTLNMILEEASQDAAVATHKTKALEDIQEMIRQVIYEGGATIKRFGQNGRLIEYTVRTNVALTAVHEPRDLQDANRSYVIETVREDSRRDPVITIGKISPPEEIAQMRHDIQLGILRHLPKLRQMQNELYKRLNEKQLASFQAPTRFLRNFAPIGAVLATLGFEWEPIVTQMIESRKERLMSQAAQSASGLVYDKILRAPIVPIPGARNAFLSVMQCATMPNGYETLNGAGLGVTLNPNNWTLIVDFVAATSPGGAVYRMHDLNKHTPPQLKALLDHHPDIIRPHRYKELGVMEALAANNITALEYEISVLTIARLREQVVRRAASYSGVPMTGTKPDSSGQSSPNGGGSANINNI